MSGLRHENIDRLIGVSCCQRPFYLLTEHCDRGSLKDCLVDGAIPSDNVEALFDVCIQAVGALAYLESQRYVIHRAVAAKNFLVAGEDRLMKLSGFERARRVSDDDYLVCPQHLKMTAQTRHLYILLFVLSSFTCALILEIVAPAKSLSALGYYGTSGSCSCHEHTLTNLATGVSRQPVLDCGMTFHLDCGGRDFP